jgi:DNA-binding response OmpR family regulator
VLDLGADAFLAKPYELQQLLDAIARLAARRQ